MTRRVAIIGAGMAGASLAAMLVPDDAVVLIEAEAHPGFHATGRSAAFWSETYGGPGVQPLTTASGPLLRAGGFLDPLGALHIGRTDEAGAVESLLAAFDGSGVDLRIVDPRSIVPGLREGWSLGIAEPSCAYIDVAALHARYLAQARGGGAELVVSAGLEAACRDAGGWRLETRAGAFGADLLVNAAGAWADWVARRAGAAPLGIQPFRRTMLQLKTDPAPPTGCPQVVHVGGGFYFKPEAGGRLWLTPHDETASAPCDAAPEEVDVALAIDRFERVVDWRVDRLEHKWAGLRSFAPDRLPVYGFDPAVPGFFWYAGQGGFGIQTAPAAAKLAAALLLERTPEDVVARIDAQRYAPGRLLI